MKKKLKNIGVLFGGKSVEHDVSIISALQVMAALDKEKYQVIPLYLSKNNVLYYSSAFSELNTFKSFDDGEYKPYFIIKKDSDVFVSNNGRKRRNSVKIDLILPIIHGQGTEDGTISSLLSFYGFVHTLPNLTSSSLLQDKDFSKTVLQAHGFAVLDSIVIHEDDFIKKRDMEIIKQYPVIVKPAHLGSSIGITVVREKEQLKDALDLAFVYDNKVIIEQALTNFSEFSCAVYQSKQELIVSSIEEIKTTKFFDFGTKYEHEGKIDNNTHVIPALINDDLKDKIVDITKKAYKLFDLTSIVRVDYLHDLTTNTLYLNEINTVPGSLAFYLFKEQGIKFEQLLDDIIKQSLYQHELQKQKKTTFSSSILNKKFKIKK